MSCWFRVLRRVALPGLFAAVALAAAPAGAIAEAPAADEITAVETLLFETDHLAGIAHPAKLEYRFAWEGDTPFEDHVILTLKGEGPLYDVEPDYLSGVQHVNFPGVEQSHGNPLLLYFLEHDLREMQRETHGSTDYFRRLIRRALAQPDLKIETTRIAVGGRELAAQRILIEPFRADPNAASRYPRLQGKSYEFVLADALPGQIYRIATRVVAADGKTQSSRVEWAGLSPL